MMMNGGNVDKEQLQALAYKNDLGSIYYEWRTSQITAQQFEVGYVLEDSPNARTSKNSHRRKQRERELSGGDYDEDAESDLSDEEIDSKIEVLFCKRQPNKGPDKFYLCNEFAELIPEEQNK
jgi:hypothetical protein